MFLFSFVRQKVSISVIFVCMYVCCDWLLWSPHSRTHVSRNGYCVCVRGNCFFFQGKRSFRYKNIIFCDIFQFLQFDPLVCCEWVLVKPITCLCVSVCVAKNTSEKRGSRACIGEEVRIQELGCVRVYWWEDHACFACCVLLSSTLCKCLCVGWYMFTFFWVFFFHIKGDFSYKYVICSYRWILLFFTFFCKIF